MSPFGGGIPITAPDDPTPPARFSASIGGYSGQSYEVKLLDVGHVEYLSNPYGFTGWEGTQRTVIAVTPEQWRKFNRGLWEAELLHWFKHYEAPGVSDGTVWSVSWEKADKSSFAECWGNNAYPRPEEFLRFEKAVSDLVGGRPFE